MKHSLMFKLLITIEFFSHLNSGTIHKNFIAGVIHDLMTIDCQQKSNSEKHYLCEGVKNFIRSQQEFLAQYERNQDIDEIRQLQTEESRIERDLCDEIMRTKKYSLSLRKILFLVVFFTLIGFVFGRYDDSLKGNFLSNLFYPMKTQKVKGKLSRQKAKRIAQKQKKQRMK